MNDIKLAVIIPTYGHFAYAVQAARTALTKSVASTLVLIVDDASPDVRDRAGLFHPYLRILNEEHGSKVRFHCFEQRGGLTRAWNAGLTLARHYHCSHACVTNSDVLFTRAWDTPLLAALEERAVALVGPVTNAPGTSAQQEVQRHYLWSYRLTDEQRYLDHVSDCLLQEFGSEVEECTLNGFCMVARTSTWWQHAFDADCVFKPRNDYNSQNQVNADPLNTLQEYELQQRWHAAGLKTGFCPGSFVFHYRSVTRGEAHKKPGWYRKAEL